MKPSKSSPFRSSIAFSVALLIHFAAPSASAIVYYWDNNGDAAGFGTAAGTWAVPTTGNSTQGWSTSSTGDAVPGDVTTTTDDLVQFGTAANGMGPGTVTVSGTVSTNRVTIPAASGAINLSEGTIELGGTNPSIVAQNQSSVIGSEITLGANATISYCRNTNTAGLFTVDGQISGDFNLTFTTPNVNTGNTNQIVFLGSANTYTGNTTITTGNVNNTTIIRAGVNNALPATTVLTLDGGNGTATANRTVSYDLNGKNQTIAGLTNITRTTRIQQIINTGGATTTLTISNTSPASSTFGGNITGTNLRLTKLGTGTQILSGNNTHSGISTISNGKLLGVVGGHQQNSDVTVNDEAATYGVSINDNTKSWTCKSLAFTAAGALEFDFGAIPPSSTVSPLTVTGLADFGTAPPSVSVNISAGLLPGSYPLMTWGSASGTAPSTPNLTVNNIAVGTSASLAISGNTLNLVISSTAAAIVKADNTTNLNDGSSWVGNTAPGIDEVAKWDSTVTSANTTNLGADLTWNGIEITNPGGPVTINAGNTLTLGAASIDMSAATADLTLNCPLAPSAANSWTVAATRTLTLGGHVSGPFGIDKLGEGTAVLSSSENNYTGATTVSEGTLKLGASDVIPNTSGFGNVSVVGTLDLNGHSETINGLSGSGTIDNTSAETSTLAVGTNAATSTFNGVIQNTVGTLNFTKTGSGTLTLAGANTLSGAVAVNGGILQLANLTALGTTSGITISNGHLRPTISSVTLAAPITIADTATIGAPTNNNGGFTFNEFVLNGAIDGTGDVTFNSSLNYNGIQTVTLNAAAGYTGATRLDTSGGNASQIIVKLGVANALPTTTVVTIDGKAGEGSGRFAEINLNGFNQTLAGLTNVARTSRVQRIVNSDVSAAATLTINGSTNTTFSGSLGSPANGSVSTNATPESTNGNNFGLTKSGSGTFTLSGSNTYTGATTISGGTLNLGGANNALPDDSPVTLGSAALAKSSTGTESASTLAVTGAATIDLASGAALAFADSSEITWAGTLAITGSFVSGESLSFGTDATGLTAAQLASISATGFTNFALDENGRLTASETGGGFSAWISGTFANGTIPLGQQGPNDDYDNDGISNLVEYAIAGQDPTVPNTSVGSFVNNVLSFTKREGASGINYAIEESTDLGIADDWTEVTGGSYVNDATTISYTLTPGSPAKNFTRLKVTAN
jgi:fibronectin-binding autotransporter adhesin